MDIFLTIIAFFVGLLIVFSIGGLIGHILKLDKYLDNEPIHRAEKHAYK